MARHVQGIGLTGDYDLHMEFAPAAPAPKPGEPDRAAVGELGALWRE